METTRPFVHVSQNEHMLSKLDFNIASIKKLDLSSVESHPSDVERQQRIATNFTLKDSRISPPGKRYKQASSRDFGQSATKPSLGHLSPTTSKGEIMETLRQKNLTTLTHKPQNFMSQVEIRSKVPSLPKLNLQSSADAQNVFSQRANSMIV